MYVCMYVCVHVCRGRHGLLRQHRLCMYACVCVGFESERARHSRDIRFRRRCTCKCTLTCTVVHVGHARQVTRAQVCASQLPDMQELQNEQSCVRTDDVVSFEQKE